MAFALRESSGCRYERALHLPFTLHVLFPTSSPGPSLSFLFLHYIYSWIYENMVDENYSSFTKTGPNKGNYKPDEPKEPV